MKRLLGTFIVSATAFAVAAGINALAQSNGARPSPSNEWPTYGHDPGGMRFSPLTQITPANVGQLQVAWVYHMRPAQTTTAPGPVGAVGSDPARGAAGSAQDAAA